MSERFTTELHWPKTLDSTDGHGSVPGADQLVQVELPSVEGPADEREDQDYRHE
jgi:hypothetical protein